MKIHKVKTGENMMGIASQYGISDWESLYHHSANQRLKHYRPDPMCLAEGDVVIIPELEPYRHTISTDQSHTITVQLPKLLFKLQVRNENGETLCNKKFELQWQSSALTGTTDGNGVIEQEIPSNVDSLALLLWPYENNEECISYQVSLGTLDPVNEVTGIQGRVNNCGIECGKVDDDFGRVSNGALNSLTDHYGENEQSKVLDKISKI